MAFRIGTIVLILLLALCAITVLGDTGTAQQHYDLAVSVAVTDADRAIDESEAAVADDPHFVKAYLLLAQLLVQTKKDLEGAVAWLDKGLSVEPGNYQLMLGKGDLLMNFGGPKRLRDAETVLKQAVAAKPDVAIGHLLLARVELHLGQKEAAISEYEKVIALDPNNSMALAEMGQLCLVMDRYDRAEKLFKRALGIDGTMTMAHIGLMALYKATGRYGLAIAEGQTLLGEKPNDPGLMTDIGGLYAAKKDYPRAIAWLKQALGADPDFARAHYNLACVYALQGKADKALAELARAIALNGSYRQQAKADPDLASLRNDERFKKLVAG